MELDVLVAEGGLDGGVGHVLRAAPGAWHEYDGLGCTGPEGVATGEFDGSEGVLVPVGVEGGETADGLQEGGLGIEQTPVHGVTVRRGLHALTTIAHQAEVDVVHVLVLEAVQDLGGHLVHLEHGLVVALSVGDDEDNVGLLGDGDAAQGLFLSLGHARATRQLAGYCGG